MERIYVLKEFHGEFGRKIQEQSGFTRRMVFWNLTNTFSDWEMMNKLILKTNE